jgi:3-isopropylmalate/(R)-2-methylmalate dehydratase small subunit
MDAFTTHTGLVAPLDRVDVDTDQIIPKQFLKSIARTGFEQGLFFDWRQDPEFVLNQPRYQDASILVAGRNFGIGSSREHAPWALQQGGFRAVISSSFGDIFRNNSHQNGFLPVQLTEQQVHDIMRRASTEEDYRLTIDLERQVVADDRDAIARFEIDPFVKYRFLNGLDDIGLTLQHVDEIGAFEARRWPLYPSTRESGVGSQESGRITKAR